jgi:hypothetical protein
VHRRVRWEDQVHEYNIWSNEHVAVYRRMQAISDLIARHDPDIIFLQVRAYSPCLISLFPPSEIPVPTHLCAGCLPIPVSRSRVGRMQEVTMYTFKILDRFPWRRQYMASYLDKEEKEFCVMVRC